MWFGYNNVAAMQQNEFMLYLHATPPAAVRLQKRCSRAAE
jgi:hypothetical protein